MALAQPDPTTNLVTDDQFAAAVRRNIKSLLAMHSMDQQDLAPLIGLKPYQLSTRMAVGSNHAAWRDAELVNIARVLEVDVDVIVALTDLEFREALSRSRCSSENVLQERHLRVVPDIADGLAADTESIYNQDQLF